MQLAPSEGFRLFDERQNDMVVLPPGSIGGFVLLLLDSMRCTVNRQVVDLPFGRLSGLAGAISYAGCSDVLQSVDVRAARNVEHRRLNGDRVQFGYKRHRVANHEGIKRSG